jgi:hypothetical protein
MLRSSQPFGPECFTTTNDYVAMAVGLGASAFMELPSFEGLQAGAAVEQDSRRWAERFLRPAVSPYGPASNVRRSVHYASGTSFDLVRHELYVGDLGLEITESVRFVLVRVLLPPATWLERSEAEASEAVDTLAEQILVTPGTAPDLFGQANDYRWSLLYEPPIRDGARFTTAPAADPAVLRSYADRLDGGVEGGTLFFLGFKAHASGDGRLIFLNGKRWFDGKCWEPYERSPRR